MPCKTSGLGGPSILFELLWDALICAKVNLVRRLAAESRVGEMRVVFGDIKLNQVFHRIGRVECLEVKSLILECSPPGLNL